VGCMTDEDFHFADSIHDPIDLARLHAHTFLFFENVTLPARAKEFLTFSREIYFPALEVQSNNSPGIISFIFA
jgi:hypothetical protein